MFNRYTNQFIHYPLQQLFILLASYSNLSLSDHQVFKIIQVFICCNPLLLVNSSLVMETSSCTLNNGEKHKGQRKRKTRITSVSLLLTKLTAASKFSSCFHAILSFQIVFKPLLLHNSFYCTLGQCKLCQVCGWQHQQFHGISPSPFFWMQDILSSRCF